MTMHRLCFAFVLTLCCACSPVEKKTYLLDPNTPLHIPEAGDTLDYTIIDIDSGSFDAVRYDWVNDTNFSNQIPVTDYLLENNDLNVSNSNIIRSRFITTDEQGNWVLLGFRSKSGNDYWIKTADGYGVPLLSLDSVHDDNETNVDADIVRCDEFSCKNTGNISWTQSYEKTINVETSAAFFESYLFSRSGSISINNEKDFFSYPFYEMIWVYPPVGVVRRNISIPGLPGESVDIDLKLRQTNIKFDAVTNETSTN